MPTISRFYGIVVRMYFLGSEHNPPHIHARYGNYIAAIEIKTGTVIEGSLPAKALYLVREWLKLYRDELTEMWETQIFKSIPPLL